MPPVRLSRAVPLLCTASLLLLLPLVYYTAQSQRPQQRRLGKVEDTSWPSSHSAASHKPSDRGSASDLSSPSDTYRVDGDTRNKPGSDRTINRRDSSSKEDGKRGGKERGASKQSLSTSIPPEVLTSWAAGQGYLRSEVGFSARQLMQVHSTPSSVKTLAGT